MKVIQFHHSARLETTLNRQWWFKFERNARVDMVSRPMKNNLDFDARENIIIIFTGNNAITYLKIIHTSDLPDLSTRLH